MNIPDFSPEDSKLGASFVGSLVALRWLPGTCWLKLQMLLTGTALSWYATEPLANWAGMNVGTTGFFLGVFGMALVAKVFELLAELHVSEIIVEWVRKFLGLPAKPPRE